MKVTNPNVKDDLTRRLRRIEGQVHGIQKMVDEERDCREILQQLTAIRSAIQSAGMAFIQEAATDCASNLEQSDPASRTAMIGDLIELLGKVSS